MQIHARQQLIDIWRNTIKASYVDGQWIPDGGNSISDAEQLLCLMSPGSRLEGFGLGRPEGIASDMLDALRPLGSKLEVPKQLLTILTDYIDRYTAADETALFPGGSYFRSRDESVEISARHRSRDVVDSFAVSITLMLAVIGFAREFRRIATRPELLAQIQSLERKASARLTAAMVGLLRSFTVNAFQVDSPMGRRLMRTVNQGRRATDQTAQRLNQELKEVIAGLRDDLVVGSGAARSEDLESPDWLFECGWSWGVVSGAPRIDTTAPIGRQLDGVAENAPYLYFTTVAMEAAQALAFERTRLPGWLDPEQLRLSNQLQVRSDLVRLYWTTVATFDSGARWPIEDLPWCTTDGRETDYYSLLVAGLVMPADSRYETSGFDLTRIGNVLDRLAERSRITARATGNVAAEVEMHHPGVNFPLVGSATATDPELEWTFTDVAPVLLKRSLELARKLPYGPQRRKSVELAERIWEHIDRRRILDGAGRGLWDRTAGVFPDVGPAEGRLNWYYTKRVVDCMVAAGQVVDDGPAPSEKVSEIAAYLLDEAEYRHDNELLKNPAEPGTPRRSDLDRMGIELRLARSELVKSPGVTSSLALEVLKKLGRLTTARRSEP